jgi:uncharacterized protein (TIGR03000 family)
MYSLVLMMALGPSADVPAHHNGGCHGCYGCNGCVGAGCHGCHGCHGGGLFHHRRNGCHGCHGCVGAGCHGCVGGAPAKAPEPIKEPKPAEKPIAAPATLVVTLPADAKLTIDGYATRSTTGSRTFVTPALRTGQEYVYTLRAEIVREGQSFTAQRQVTVRGGEQTAITLEIPVASVVQN